ncbi:MULTISPECIES: hypothetical protein [unclassified Shinella]|uniref:hypothetical protein n=1 Tax=unclassified Shinella TaxID=2643062 RepID=UPI0012E2C7E4|nr:MULTISPECIES: hypothetical protein [unclassified Shinella]
MLVFTERLLNILPPKGRAKAIMLDEERAAASAVVKAALNDLEAGWQRRDEIEQKLVLARQHDRTGTVSLARMPLDRLRAMLSRSEEEPEVHPLLVKAELEIRERLQPRLDRASDAFQSFAVVGDIAQWLAGAAEAGVRFVDAPEVKLPAKAVPEEVERVRSKIAAIEAAINDTTFAPLPLADVKEAIVREISEIAAKGQPRVCYNDRRSSPLKLGEALGISNSPAGPSTAATLVWAMQEIITERALSLVGDIEPERALTNAQRDALLEQLAAERLEAERNEEAAIMAAHAAGIAIARRREADPRAVLGIKDVSGRWRTRADVGLDDVA